MLHEADTILRCGGYHCAARFDNAIPESALMPPSPTCQVGVTHLLIDT